MSLPALPTAVQRQIFALDRQHDRLSCLAGSLSLTAALLLSTSVLTLWGAFLYRPFLPAGPFPLSYRLVLVASSGAGMLSFPCIGAVLYTARKKNRLRYQLIQLIYQQVMQQKQRPLETLKKFILEELLPSTWTVSYSKAVLSETKNCFKNPKKKSPEQTCTKALEQAKEELDKKL